MCFHGAVKDLSWQYQTLSEQNQQNNAKTMKEEKVRIYVPNLATLGIYNKLMGGVDKADMLLELCKNVKLQQNSMQFIFLLLQLLGRCFVK